MKTNHWTELSQRFYRQLLRLYPQTYRIIYEAEMFRVFTDQCREEYQQRGRLGILLLWLRTFMDLGKTVVIEHISDPNAKVGLLDASPNKPLPWKGVLLLLVPGLIFFVSQIEQLASSNDWFFVAFYRAGYFLILPVLLILLLTRKFPVWGFVPLGLLYETLLNYGNRIQLSELPVVKDWFTNDTVVLFNMTMSSYTFKYLLAALVFIVLLGALIWYNARQGKISRSAWIWLTLCGLLILFQIGVEMYRFSISIDQAQIDAMGPTVLREFFVQIPLWHFYDSLPLLVLIFIGMFFARKYKGFSFLLILGYLLPTIIYGRYGEWTDIMPFSVVVLVVLMYRSIVALVAPVWLVRAISTPAQQMAIVIPVAAAIFCTISFNLLFNLAAAKHFVYQLHFLDYALGTWDQLIIAAGLGLAVTLYFPRQQNDVAIFPPLAAGTK